MPWNAGARASGVPWTQPRSSRLVSTRRHSPRAIAVLALSTLLTACGGGDDAGAGPDDAGPRLTDAELSALARASTGWTYWRNRPDTLVRSGGSGHAEARLRTRYNARAATQLDPNGRVRAEADFPDSSLIVKELIAGSALVRYAVMYKLRASPDAGGGWLWAYYAPDGGAQISLTARGGACVGCHSTGIDRTRMNDSHP